MSPHHESASLAAVAITYLCPAVITAVSSAAPTIYVEIVDQTRYTRVMHAQLATAQASVITRLSQKKPVKYATAAEAFLLFVTITLTVQQRL